MTEEIRRISETLTKIFSLFGDPWELAERNSLLPWLYERTPDPRYRRTYEVTVARSLSQSREDAACRAAFCEAGIPLIPLKGGILREAYPAPHLRQMYDLDYLYRKEDQEKAHEVMVRLGYEPDKTGEYHHDEYVKPPLLTVELHRDLIPGIFKVSRYFDWVWEKAIENAEGAWELPMEIQYLFFIAHFAKHMTERGGAGIRSLVDLYFWDKAWGDQMNRDEISEGLNEMELAAFENKYREMALCLFSRDNPALEPYRKELRFMTLCGTFGDAEVSAEQRIQHDGGSRAGYVFRRLFPSYRAMCVYFPRLSKCPPLLPFYYVKRMFRALTVHRGSLRAECNALKENKRREKEQKKAEKARRKAEKKNKKKTSSDGDQTKKD